MQSNELIEKADELLTSADEEDMSPHLRSLVVSYKRRRDAEETRAAATFAKALLVRAEREGLVVAKEATIADLRAAIASRNEGRDEADLIKPAGRSKADLQAALDADDARQ